MPIEMTQLETATAFDRLLLALIGKEKSGKSRLAATGRTPILFLDYDNRKESLAGMKDIYAISFRDSVWPKQPDAIPETLNVLENLEISGFDIGSVIKGAPRQPLKTLVFDSISSMAQMAMNYALYQNKDIRREYIIGGKIKVQTPKGWDGWGAEMQTIQSIITRALGYPLDIIVILHETAEEAADSTDENPRYTGKVAVYPPRYKILLKNFNEVWRVSRDMGNEPQVQLVADYRFTAATNLNLNGLTIVPNITEMIQKSLSLKTGTQKP